MKIHPLGSYALIEDDRPALVATSSPDLAQVFLDYSDPIDEIEVALGWFSADDLQRIVDAARGEKA